MSLHLASHMLYVISLQFYVLVSATCSGVEKPMFAKHSAVFVFGLIKHPFSFCVHDLYLLWPMPFVHAAAQINP